MNRNTTACGGVKRTVARRRGREKNRQWRLMDLHLHTPASSDYQEPGVSFLDILHRCEARGLEIVSFTDHNTVAGFRTMQDEIQQLEMLETVSYTHLTLPTN